tara:strand:+ start:1979 stop:2233 length:255 start_codon:yes stop_codon:yes gene_type:complete
MKKWFKGWFFDSWGISELGMIVIMFLVISVLLGSVITLVNAHKGWQCGNYEKITGRKSLYVYFDGCYVYTESGKIIKYDDRLKE